MWSNIFLESDLESHPRARKILELFPKSPVTKISSYDEYWGRFKKPYLHKRDELNLYLAQKKGQLVKMAPDAYGLSGEPHYYFIHAYNCIYECQYCYLQGHFNTPDLVLFLNHEDIILEMKEAMNKHDNHVWFHAGEFSDSLALSHLTGELPLYFDFFYQNPKAYLELRTKSANIKELKKLDPSENIIVSFSLSPESIARRIDLKTPGLKARLEAMRELKNMGHELAIHLDPIIYTDTLDEDYRSLFTELKERDLITTIRYVSLGVVRFTKDVHREVERNYPDSLIHTQPMINSFDNKVRYNHALRHWMLNKVKSLALEYGFQDSQLYLCMEDDA